MSHKKNYFLHFLRWSLKLLFFSVSFYLLLVVIGGYVWTINPKEKNTNQIESAGNETDNEIEVYVTSNGFHTDIVIPIKYESEQESEQENEIETIFFKTLAQDSLLHSYFTQSNYNWLSVGWGDKGFYNESYNGNFPSFSACLNAAFLPSETLMHVDFYRNKLREGKNCKKIKLKKAEYQEVLQHIVSSFRTVREESKNSTTQNKNSKFIRLPQKGYSNSDYFFEADNSYHLFYTCNSWTNEGLQKANQKTARFAPLAQTILYHLE